METSYNSFKKCGNFRIVEFQEFPGMSSFWQSDDIFGGVDKYGNCEHIVIHQEFSNEQHSRKCFS